MTGVQTCALPISKWSEFVGDVKLFVNFFPELSIHKDFGAGGIAAGKATAPADMFKLLGGTIDSKFVRVISAERYSIVGHRTQYASSADSPIAVVNGNDITIFGVTSSDNFEIDYIKSPLTTDGKAYSSSATGEDIPFYEFWEEQIAQIASELFNIDAQNYS